MSLSLLRKLCKAEGQVRVNNTTTNNLMLIGCHVFILSFSNRLNSLGIMSTNFECAVMTDNKVIYDELKIQLDNIFVNSVLFRM